MLYMYTAVLYLLYAIIAAGCGAALWAIIYVYAGEWWK